MIIQRAENLANKVSAKFEAAFGFKPIIAGSLSLILAGYTPNRYKDYLNVADVDLEIPSQLYHEWANRIPNFEGKIEELSTNMFDVKAIDNFINNLRVEGYCSTTHTDLGEHPHWYWLGDIKVGNPMIALKAKAHYVVNGISGYATTEIFKTTRIKRNHKHYSDIVTGVKVLRNEWQVPPFVEKISTMKSIRDSVFMYEHRHEFNRVCNCLTCKLHDLEGWDYNQAKYMIRLGVNTQLALGL